MLGYHCARVLKKDRFKRRGKLSKIRNRRNAEFSKSVSITSVPQASGIVVDKIGVEAKQPNSAIRKAVRIQLVKSGKQITAFVPLDGGLNCIDTNDLVHVAGFGKKGRSKGDIPNVRFVVIKVQNICLKSLVSGKKEKPAR